MKRGFQQFDDVAGVSFGDQQPFVKTSRFAKSLCASNINDTYPDEAVVSELQSTFQQFGDMQVKIAGYMGRRVAYLNFYEEKAANEAYDRFLSKTLQLFDRSIHIEPVRANRPRPNNISNMNDKTNERFGPQKMISQNRRDGPDPKSSFRYAHHLDRTPPEEDPNSTRTLFIGNLDPNITKEDIAKAFSAFGLVLDVDIKFAANQKNPVCFAFLRYKTVDEAYAAKLGMSGQSLLSHTCKIGYGKIVPSSCLWVGNISASTSPAEMEREAAKVGQIMRFKYEMNASNGERFAVILYESNEAAIKAASKLRGLRFPKTTRRLRVDFITPDEFDQYFGVAVGEADEGSINTAENIELSAITQASTLPDLLSVLPRVWSGALTVKSTSFACDLLGLAGDCELVASLLANTAAQSLRICQRISLVESHLDELRKRCILARGSYCVMLSAQSSDPSAVSRVRKIAANVRPFRSLSAYLQSKYSMGVFLLQSAQAQASNMLCYVLPNCSFVDQLMTKCCPNLTFDHENCSKEDFLMLICFRSIPLHA